jgi:hypothetical protein
MDASKLKKGDTVIYIPANSNSKQECVVEKVGSKYVYAHFKKFYAEDGVEVTRYAPAQILTLEEDTRRVRVRIAAYDIAELGVIVNDKLLYDHSEKAQNKILAIRAALDPLIQANKAK